MISLRCRDFYPSESRKSVSNHVVNFLTLVAKIWKNLVQIFCKLFALKTFAKNKIHFQRPKSLPPRGSDSPIFYCIGKSKKLRIWQGMWGGGAVDSERTFLRQPESLFQQGTRELLPKYFLHKRDGKTWQKIFGQGRGAGGGTLWEMLDVSKVLPQPKILDDPAGALDRGPRGVRKNIANFCTAHWTLWWFFRNLKNHFHMPNSIRSGGSPRSSPFWFKYLQLFWHNCLLIDYSHMFTITCT